MTMTRRLPPHSRLFLAGTAAALLGCSTSNGVTGSGDGGGSASKDGGTTPVDATSSADANVPIESGASVDGESTDGASAHDAGATDARSDAPSQGQACATHFLPTLPYLTGFDDPEWYVENIPFLDVPDALTGTQIQPIYYYRWSTLKRALRYTDAVNGYVFLEFLEPPGYASTFGAINAAAGHHLYESRWLRDLRYGDDYLQYWLTGAGKTGIREYSFWVADSAWARYEVSSDGAFVKSLLAPLEANYDAWSDHYDATLGLYWQVPVWDAMEYSADSYSSQNPDGDAYHGGTGYRPTINAYQFADARAIAAIANLSGDTATATTYTARASALVTAMQTHLWSPQSSFFVHMYKTSGQLFSAGGGREEIGFVPWQFEMPAPGYEAAWQNTITSATGTGAFATGYGPTSVAKDNPYYLSSYAVGSCCHWNGPLWPYATTQTLKAMANLLNDYTQSYVTKADYFALLSAYAKSQFKNGEPYIAEALDPDDTKGSPIWTYDSPGHSEHYNHSGFVDPVITGLIGLHPSADDIVRVNPLTPDAWTHFLLENVAYHGHFLTIVWDQDGSHYGAGTGFTIYEDCAILHQQATLGPVAVPLQGGTWAPTKPPRLDNVFSNAAGGTVPLASASYTFSADAIGQLNDGIVLYDRSVNGSPNNANIHNRWTNYQSPNASDWVQIDLGAPTSIAEVTLHVYDDTIGVVPPSAYAIATSTDGTTWQPVSHLQTLPATPAAGPNVARFDAVSARYVRVTFTMSPSCAQGKGCVGLTELEAWTVP
jgi:hypothetical protein